MSNSLEEFIEAKKKNFIKLNEHEFRIEAGECSKTSPHTSVIKSMVVDNLEGNALLRFSNKSRPAAINDTDERLKNLENRLSIQPDNASDIHARLKAVENKILKLEEMYPQIAAHTLNYEDSTDHRQGGRLTKAPGFYRGLRVSKKKRKNAPTIAPIGISIEAEHASEILADRMESLKKRLLK